MWPGNIFDFWTEQRTVSTMQRLQAENAKLRRQAAINLVVYWVGLLAVVGLAMFKFWKGC